MLKDLLDFIQQGGAVLATIAVVLGAAIATLKIYFQYRTAISEKEHEQDAFRATQAPENLDNLSEILVQNLRILNSSYSESLYQYRTSAIASVAIAVIVFEMISSVVLIVLLGKQIT